MLDYQEEFLRLAIDTGALRFGAFTLKSGRRSPYFFNIGLFNTGRRLLQLGRCYAQTIRAAGIPADTLFGPAYKGIPLVTASAIALAAHDGLDMPYAFNRKEAKDHGEGGTLIGGPLQGRVLIVDDVITAGTSVRESVDIIRREGAEPAGVVIALDRQERGTGERSAVEQVRLELGLPVAPIVTLDTLIEFLDRSPVCEADLVAVRRYREQYGARSGAATPGATDRDG